jgi:hypothetical protein
MQSKSTKRSEIATRERAERLAKREKKNPKRGEPHTAEGRKLLEICVERLSDFVTAELDRGRKERLTHAHPNLFVTLSRLHALDRNVIAMSALVGLMRAPTPVDLDDIDEGGGSQHVVTLERMGQCILDACKARGRRVFQPQSRTQKSNYYLTRRWEPDQCVRCGGWALDCILQALPDTFMQRENTWFADSGGQPLIELFEIQDSVKIAMDAGKAAELAEETMWRDRSVFRPRTTPPSPWVGWRISGYDDSQLTAPIVRNASKETKAAVTAALAAINNGSDHPMREHLRALNSMQNVAFQINKRIFDVVKWRHDEFDDVVIKQMTQKIRVITTKWGKKLKIPTGKWVEVSDVWTVNDDLAVAEGLLGAPFWNDMNLDTRGRFYSLPNFHFGRRDYVRAMFLFAYVRPLGEEGLYWLKSQVASLGASAINSFDGGIDRRPFDDRVAWADANMRLIHWAADHPKESHHWWSRAGARKKFQFLAAMIELSAAMRSVDPTAFESRLPIHFDCTTSGLQHLAAMSLDEVGGAWANLVPNDVPRSFYRGVRAALLLRIQKFRTTAMAMPIDLPLRSATQPRNEWEWEFIRAAITWEFFIKNADDAWLKTASMSDFYGSGAEEKARQVHKWIVAQWFEKGLAVAVSNDDASDDPLLLTALGDFIRETVDALAPRSMAAKRWITNIAGTLAKQNIPLTLVSASGFPLVNAYHPFCTKLVEVYWEGKRHEFTTATGHDAKFDKERAITTAAANVTHTCDAALNALVVNACIDADITNVVTVHDCVGVHARYAGQARESIREQFRRMYETNDVLKQLHDNAARDLGSDRRETVTIFGHQVLVDKLPPSFEKGNLDLTRLTGCEYLTNQ